MRLSSHHIKHLTLTEVDELLPNPQWALAVKSNLRVMNCLVDQIELLEQEVKANARLKPAFQSLLTVTGIGTLWALTILLETGDIGRFARVGQFASYCRCVDSQRLSNGKKKGTGNVKNGNRYLAWAFIEAANFAIRYNPKIKAFYQRKKAKTNGLVAVKAVAHQLARACYDVMRDPIAFETHRAFA